MHCYMSAYNLLQKLKIEQLQQKSREDTFALQSYELILTLTTFHTKICKLYKKKCFSCQKARK